MRIFDAGATRDSDDGKLSYSRFLDPRVIKRYCEYLQKHRVQADGNLREPDNWKNGIPPEVSLDSMMRHVMDVWLSFRGYPEEMTENLEDSLCAIMFNAQSILFEIMEWKHEKDNKITSSDL